MVQAETVYRVAAVCDALGTRARPGVIAVREGRVVAAGSADAVGIDADAVVVDLPRTLVLPALVNAHAHLDLTTIGPKPYGGDFAGWLRSVIDQAPVVSHEGAVRRGVSMSRGSGVACVGDIARSCQGVLARWSGDGLPGVSYLECVGIGSGQDAAIGRLTGQLSELMADQPSRLTGDRDHGLANPRHPVALGISPHAPYSAGLDLYGASVRLAESHGYLLTTHLAETLEEVAFVRDGQGPLVDLLRHLGKWDASMGPTGLHPVEWLEPVLAMKHWLLVHCNHVQDRHIEILARCQASVAYCPVASDYFGHHRPDLGRVHRYRDMLDAGVNVCLGTDSILCQRPDDPHPLGMGSQMRHLYRRDGTDPATILAMATVNGMRAMGRSPLEASLQPGVVANGVGVEIDPEDSTEPLVQALAGDQPMAPLLLTV